MLRFLKALLVDGFNLLGWLGRVCIEGMTGRSFAAERAQRVQAEAAQEQAEARDKAETTHRANVEALATETLAATVEMAEAVKAAVTARPVDIAAERRARQARFTAEHAAAMEVRSSAWTPVVEDEPALTWRPA